MKQCPICRQTFTDDLAYCTSDGTQLRVITQGMPTVERTVPLETRPVAPSTMPIEKPEAGPGERNSWKVAFFVLLIASLAGNGVMLYLLMSHSPARPVAPPPGATAPATAAAPEAPAAPKPLTDMSREEILAILPKNLLRRFQTGTGAPGLPDALRVISDGRGGEFVAMLGPGRLEGTQQPAPRVLILQREGEEFRDVTGDLLPAAYRAGTLGGPGAEARFDESSTAILVREPASSRAIVAECATCEPAYQRVMLEWRSGRYIEARREWENAPYTAFYLVAEALEKRKVEAAARPFIDASLDERITKGFARRSSEGWTVVTLSKDVEAGRAEYELSNGSERLIVTVARVVDAWRAVGLTAQ